MIRVCDGIINEDRIIAAFPSPEGGTTLIMDGVKSSVPLECEFGEFEAALLAANLLTVGTGVDTIQLTAAEVAELRRLHDNEYRYIARDGDGKVFAYKAEPVKGSFGWRMTGVNADGTAERVLKGFDFLRWDDDQPLCIIAALQAQESI